MLGEEGGHEVDSESAAESDEPEDSVVGQLLVKEWHFLFRCALSRFRGVYSAGTHDGFWAEDRIRVPSHD